MNKEQQSLCKRYGARFMPLDDIYKAAFRKTLCAGAYPSTACVIRLKAKPEVGLSAQVSIRTMTFFQPLHAHHLASDCPARLEIPGRAGI